MKNLKALFLVLVFAAVIAACKNDAPGGEIQVGIEHDLGGATQVKLVNGHNGYSTTITDENDIAEIAAFVGETIGKSQGSGKGYYEGSYSVVFSYEDGEEFTLVYGDSDCFYMGKGEDGYPIRYILCHINITDDVIPFFSQYDQSGMVWGKTD